MSARARESFKVVGIRGGAGPGEGAPSAPAPYYNLSESDRSTFENTIDMVHDNDIKKSSTAKEALNKAFQDRPIIKHVIDDLYHMPIVGNPFPLGFFAEGAWQTMCFMGYCTETKWEIPESPGFCHNDFSGVGITSVDIQGDTYSVQGGQAFRFEDGAAHQSIEDNGSTVNYHIGYPTDNKCRPVICKNGAVIDEIPDCAPSSNTGLSCSPAGGATTLVSASGATFDVTSCRDSANVFAYLYDNLAFIISNSLAGDACNPNWDLSGTDTNFQEGDVITVGFRNPDGSVVCDVLGNGQYAYTPELSDIQPVGGAGDFPTTNVPLEDTCKIIDDLQDDPDLQPYLPPPGTPPGSPPGTPPVIPPPVDTPPVQPPDPGTNPPPGQPPVDPTPDGECFIDATTISAAAVNALKSGIAGAWSARTNDNAERLYAPQGSDGCRDFDRIDEAYLIDALVAEGWSNDNGHVCPPASWCASSPPPNVPPGVPIPPIVPPGPVVPGIDPIGDGITDPGEGGCMTLSKEPAAFRDPTQAGGIARQYQPGQPMVIDYGEGSRCKTKIIKVKPNTGEDGGPEICVGGGIDNGGKTVDKTCYGPGPVTDAIQSVLGEMIAEGGSIIFDSDCDRELRRPLCFRAGTSKRVILNKLLDMCGFCMFPQFDCNVIVGYCGPVNVVWTYHEDVDLIKFDLEYDGQEVYDYVEVFRGDWISRAGNVFVRGNSVLYPVGSPASSVSGDRIYQYEVPYSTPDSELASIAITLAAKLRAQALPEIAFGVPLNSMLNQRHQLRIQMPSLGFDAYYMITRLARDYDRENGHLSTGLARWLSAAPKTQGEPFEGIT